MHFVKWIMISHEIRCKGARAQPVHRDLMKYFKFYNSVSRGCQLYIAKCLCHAKIASVEQCGSVFGRAALEPSFYPLVLKLMCAFPFGSNGNARWIRRWIRQHSACYLGPCEAWLINPRLP